MGTSFKSGKEKAAKVEEYTPPFICCAQEGVGLQNPLPIRLLGYGKKVYSDGHTDTFLLTQLLNSESILMLTNLPCVQIIKETIKVFVSYFAS